jgi:threonine synthase
MRYVSTRGGVPPAGFEEVLFAGLARDGGLYVPESWPHWQPEGFEALQGTTYPSLAEAVLRPFIGEALEDVALQAMLSEAYATFRHHSVAPLRQIGPNEWLMELHHGPTLAFKDVALQLLGRLFEHFLKIRGQRITILCATSGDTGAAAIAACAGRAQMDVVILHPRGRVSEVQRRQMTTEPATNVHNVAIEGTFDDCQDLVKALFNDAAFRDALGLAAINSINWARIVAQAVYYVAAALALGAPWRQVAFSVPTGNFGNVFAGYVAAQLGLPVAQLIVATNVNDILARFFETNRYQAGEVVPTQSPSMDIQVASNFERLLFDLAGSQAVARMMAEFQATRTLQAGEDEHGRARELLDGGRADETETAAAMACVWRECGILIDPHTAVGVHVGRKLRADPRVPLVTLATAHPAKFPDAVEAATGVRPQLPPELADLYARPERYDILEADPDSLKTHIRRALSRAS